MSLFSWGSSGRKLTNPSDATASDLVGPACTIAALPTDGTPFAPTRAIISNAKGTATIVDFAGHTLTGFPLTGVEQSIAITSLSSLATATAVWGLY